MFNTFTSK